MNESNLWSEIYEAGTQVLKLLAQGTLTAAAVAALSWLTVEWFLPIGSLVGWGRERQTEAFKRLMSFLFGQFMVLLAHGAGVVDFGAGPRGWLAAWFFSFVGGGLAPALHDLVKEHFPRVTNSTGDGA